MIACPSCGVRAPDDSAFCSKCGAKLGAPPPAAQERKTVTTLFCDLVAFTAMSEAADPEDVDALLGEYFARATRVIESHGGTVEKFIGDAVVGVFGVPAVHEDDPERAVRAGLRLLEALEGMTRPDGAPLQARCGVNTGEALVRLDVDPASGRGFLTGDAVNVAARLEAAAPPMGVVVGRLTHKLTAHAIVFEELTRVAAKGKAEPVPAWLAKSTLARRGVEARGADLTPLVGRETELAHLVAMFDEAVTQSAPRFVLLVGEPGIGKSRLLRELSSLVDAGPEMMTWRQGYCPPFGEDITYGALAEIVKGHAGIHDNDPLEAVEAKLEAVLPEGPDRQWLRQRLRALLGFEAPEASREENFAAWLRFFEAMARREPVVLVFEDLHWADDALLSFLEYLIAHLGAVPLLIAGTARPDLFERRPTFASAGPVSCADLGPLSPSETAQLVTGLLGGPDDRAGAVGTIVERCEGNPFFAEQSARLLVDTSLQGSLPDSVQAVIAARLDTLPVEEKALLADASVVGTVFWEGTLSAMGPGESQRSQDLLSRLLERRLIHRLRESTMEGEREFAFVHALARDVVYGQLPRAARAQKHAAVAAWLAARAGARLDELVEVIAHHSATALELARASGRDELAESLTAQTVRYLTLAGDRSFQLDCAAAERHFRRALDLLPDRHPERPALLLKWGGALFWLGDFRQAADAVAEAVAGFREAGDVRAAAAAMTQQLESLRQLGDPSVPTILSEALAVLETDGPSPELVLALERLAHYRVVYADNRAAVDAAERAMVMAERLGLPLPIEALHYRGAARCSLGDAGGLADLQRALAAAEDRGWAWLVANIHFNLADATWLLEGAAAAVDARRRVLDYTERRGQQTGAHGSRAALAGDLIWAGDWDEALALFLETEPMLEAVGEVDWLVGLRSNCALLCALRGQVERARAPAAWAHERSIASGYPQELGCATVAHAVVCDAVGDWPATRAALDAYERLVADRVNCDRGLRLALTVRVALRVGDVALAERFTAKVTPSVALYRHALASTQASIAEARGEHEAAAGFADAAAGWHDFGVPYEEAQALLGQGRCLVALGRAPEAVEPLGQAHDIFERLGARPALAETDQVLQQVACA